MKAYTSNMLLAGLLATVALFIGGCGNDAEDSPPIESIQGSDPASAEEELILPPDSKGEGSEPKESAPFGGATQPEDASEE